jgi:hypothetical protein
VSSTPNLFSEADAGEFGGETGCLMRVDFRAADEIVEMLC